MAMDPVDAVISGEVRSLEHLRPLAPKVVEWLKESLATAHTNHKTKQRVKLLLGAPRFAPNLEHLGLWNDLIADCKEKALALGQDMQTYFVESELGTALGQEAVPNVFGNFEIRPRNYFFMNIYIINRIPVTMICK